MMLRDLVKLAKKKGTKMLRWKMEALRLVG